MTDRRASHLLVCGGAVCHLGGQVTGEDPLGAIKVTLEAPTPSSVRLFSVCVHLQRLAFGLALVLHLIVLVEVDDQLSWDVVAQDEDAIVHRDSAPGLWVAAHVRVLVVVGVGKPVHAQGYQILAQKEIVELVEGLVDHLLGHWDLPDVSLLDFLLEDLFKLLFEGALDELGAANQDLLQNCDYVRVVARLGGESVDYG